MRALEGCRTPVWQPERHGRILGHAARDEARHQTRLARAARRCPARVRPWRVADGVQVQRRAGGQPYPVIVCFCPDREPARTPLAGAAPADDGRRRAVDRVAEAGVGVATDLDEHVVRDHALAHGRVDVKIARDRRGLVRAQERRYGRRTMSTMIIEVRYNGPPDSGNGGWTAGLVGIVRRRRRPWSRCACRRRSRRRCRSCATTRPSGCTRRTAPWWPTRRRPT